MLYTKSFLYIRIDRFDIYLTIIFNNRYIEKHHNISIISAFLPSYSLFAFVSTHWNEQQTMMLKIRVMKKLSECDLCDLDINSLMRKNINKTENKYWLLTRYIFWRMIICRISSQRYSRHLIDIQSQIRIIPAVWEFSIINKIKTCWIIIPRCSVI